MQCYKCDKFGHTYKVCPEWKKIQAALAEVKDKNLEFCLALSSDLKSNKNTWIIDSEASRHITGFKDKFETIED